MRVNWPMKTDFMTIIKIYIGFIRKIVGEFSNRVSVVFDGYLIKSTKDHIHQKRYPITSMEILVSPDAQLQCGRDVFLSNPKNKHRFITMLGEELKKEDIQVIQCKQDADVHVVKCAMQKLTQKNVILVGDDTDLLILSIHYMQSHFDSVNDRSCNNLHILRQMSNSCINVKVVLDALPLAVKRNVLAIHAISGCDTVSQLYGIGKDKLFKQISKKPDIARGLEPFLAAEYDEASIKAVGLDIIAGLYNIRGSKYEDVRPM